MIALIYGGSGSGKSRFAENMMTGLKEFASALFYVATMYPGDAEARGRIARHQADRAHKGFATIEVYTNLDSVNIPDGSAVLLECLGNLVANEMFSPDGAGEGAMEAVLRGVEAVSKRAVRVVAVTNDVFSDGVLYPPETERYRRVLGELNKAVAQKSAVVVETVCGLPLWHKRDKGWNP